MTLVLLILLPLMGGGVAWLYAGRNNAERWITLATLGLVLLVVVWLFATAPPGQWITHFELTWAPALGISFVFALDGLSGVLIGLSAVLGIAGVLASWKEITHRSGLFHFCICWTVSATTGVFVSFDLLVFAFFWEAMLLPPFLMIAIWGHGDREAAALKFLVFNAAAGLGLLASVFALAAFAPTLTFNAFILANARLDPTTQTWLLLGFSLAFLVKLPALPFHAWLPDAHGQAPTAGSILLAGILLKTGAYGLFRFPTMLFPDASLILAPWGVALGTVSAVYGGLVACSQNDAKRLVAYSSVAHMGIVLVGICAGTQIALTGAGVEMIAHAFSAAGLFLLVGALSERTGTRDLRELGGLQSVAPRFAAAFAMFYAAALAMPGTANFIGEALVVVGIFPVSWPVALIALTTVLVSVIYATRLLKGIVFGEVSARTHVMDLEAREVIAVVLLALGTLTVGLAPQTLVGLISPTVEATLGALQR